MRRTFLETIGALAVAMLGAAPVAAAPPSAAPPTAASPTAASPSGAGKLPVVVTFGVLADVVAQVGGDAVEVRSLIGAGGDVHVFQPGPNHARQLADARLVVINGLGFEGWIKRLIRSSGYRGPVAVATAGIDPLRVAESHDHGKASAAGHGVDQGADPHAWQSVPNMKRYVANVADALCAAEPAACACFRANAERYLKVLDQLDREIRAALAAIPAGRRKVITSHGAFAYYAREYGVQFLAPVGVSTDTEPSAAAVGRLIRQIRQEKVGAFFVEGISDPRLIERIRSETGGSEPGVLFSDGLSLPDGPAPTYEAMMRFNTRSIIKALSAPAAVPPAGR